MNEYVYIFNILCIHTYIIMQARSGALFGRNAKVLVLQERDEMFNRLGRHCRITESIGVHVLTRSPTRPSMNKRLLQVPVHRISDFKNDTMSLPEKQK